MADEIVPIAATTGRPHRTLVGEYYNAAWNEGHAATQVAGFTADLVAAVRAGSPTTGVAMQTSSNSASDKTDGHAPFDAFVTAILASPADAIVRIDQYPYIRRGGSVADGTSYQGDRLHLTGTTEASGYRTKAALIGVAFAAWPGG